MLNRHQTLSSRRTEKALVRVGAFFVMIMKTNGSFAALIITVCWSYMSTATTLASVPANTGTV